MVLKNNDLSPTLKRTLEVMRTRRRKYYQAHELQVKKLQLEELRRLRYVDKKAFMDFGRVTYKYFLTKRGLKKAKEILKASGRMWFLFKRRERRWTR